ncbi:phosphoprotein phosphatase [Favolaschia claudopus]|uniref:Mitochondrial import inner membrane translocase subunit TIM50 n=1 Tax=Favolaschia claudopus TaxID=2862362 RepID=A0AAW0BAX0_9AGAR
MSSVVLESHVQRTWRGQINVWVLNMEGSKPPFDGFPPHSQSRHLTTNVPILTRQMLSARKLLILDLNGTLLLRSKQGRPPTKSGVRMRTVYPRPFLKSFREYIFHPSTMKWLDTMVWSSAQPPSVADMVKNCFGQLQHNLKAIWARDTMGLPPELYNKKTQTTKDLARPWAAFTAHSRQTTLLLDDSARKAHLHPHNHICVREYVREIRQHDVKVWASASANTNSPKDAAPKKQRKPKSKKAAPDLAASVDSSVNAPPAWFLSAAKYDETLLAVVGILETIKDQPDVAQWIAGGGLLAAEVKDDTVVAQAQADSAAAADLLTSQMAALSLAQELWFNNESTVNYWAGRGVHTLQALQIPVSAGISSGSEDEVATRIRI